VVKQGRDNRDRGKEILKWIKPMENDFIGGVEIASLTRARTPQGEA